jgi:hypothetical protein
MFFTPLLFALLARAQDIIGSAGCTAAACVFANPALRFGTGAENSVNTYGLFQQPWYYSPTATTWYKLTYYNYPLDTAIGTGSGSPHWSGTNIMNLYSLTVSESSTDYSQFIVDSSDTTKSVGHGKIVASRLFSISGQAVIIENTFSLGFNESFVKIVTKLINNSTAVVQNAIIWTGTRDDYVGSTDSNMKTRGNLNTGSFVAITANNQPSRAIMITNTNEGVLFYSETPGVMTAFQMCCAFSNVYNVDPLSIPPATSSPTDGSYAAVLPIGDLEVGASGSITWYYAAGIISSLGQVAQEVAAAQVAEAPPVASSTGAASASWAPSWTGGPSWLESATPFYTTTEAGSASAEPSITIVWSSSVSGSSSSNASSSSYYTPTSVFSNTGTGSASATSSSSSSSTSTPSTSQLALRHYLTLHVDNDIVANVIVINIVTIIIAISGIGLVGFCGFFCYNRYLTAISKSAPKEDLTVRTVDLKNAWA